MVAELIVFRLLVIFAALMFVIALYRATRTTKKKDANVIDVEKLTGKDLEEYISVLKERIKKAEERWNSGIESAQSELQMCKDQLENITKLKNKTKDL